MSDDRETMIEKVEKLLRKAERAGTPEEADAFFSKAQELMTKWSIDETILNLSGEATRSDDLTEEVVIMKRSGYFDPMVRLIAGIGLANDVKVLVRKPSSWGVNAGAVLIGWKTDIEKTKMLYASLLLQLSRERRRDLTDEIRAYPESMRNRWKHSYSFAYADRIAERLAEVVAATKEEAVRADSTGSLLPALLDRKDAVDRYYAEKPKGKANNRSRLMDRDGLNSGRSAANRADLGGSRVGSGPSKAIGR